MPGRRQIPPLKGLATLECVVRHQSVTLAADELCVTHGAVSKQLAALAAWIGQPLFADNRRRMVPTPAGLRLAEAVATGMRGIYDALDEVQGVTVDADAHLQVFAPATLAMYWLIPRLPVLRRSGLKMKAEVRHTHTYENWQDQPFDLAILAGQRLPASYERAPVFRDRLGLVASPEVAADIGAVEDLDGLTLLESETRPGELDDWLTATGTSRSRCGTVETFDHNYIAIEAALTGHGAVVAPLAVVGNHLGRGSLVRVLPESTIPGPEFNAVYDPRSTSAVSARAFAGWLRSLASQDVARTVPPRAGTTNGAA